MNRLFFGLFAIQTTRTLPRTSVPQKHPISSPRVISRQPRGRSVSQFTGKFRLQPLRALLLIMGEDGCYELATPSQQAAPNQRSPFISLCLAPSPQGVRPAPGLPHLPSTSGKLSRVRGCRWLALDSLTHPLTGVWENATCTPTHLICRLMLRPPCSRFGIYIFVSHLPPFALSTASLPCCFISHCICSVRRRPRTNTCKTNRAFGKVRTPDRFLG